LTGEQTTTVLFPLVLSPVLGGKRSDTIKTPDEEESFADCYSGELSQAAPLGGSRGARHPAEHERGCLVSSEFVEVKTP